MWLSRIIKGHQIKIVSPVGLFQEKNEFGVEGEALPPEEHGAEMHLETAKKMAEDILFEAELNAQEINRQMLREAKAYKEQARQAGLLLQKECEEKGYQTGYEEGLKAGRQEGLEQWFDLIGKADNELQAMTEKLAVWRDSLSLEVIDLSEEIARRIIGAELEVKPEKVVQRIAKALQQIVNVKDVLIKVAMEDVLRVEGARESLFNFNSSLTHIRIAGAEDLKRGDFLLETDMGGVNGRLDTQLGLIHKELVEEWQRDGKS